MNKLRGCLLKLIMIISAISFTTALSGDYSEQKQRAEQYFKRGMIQYKAEMYDYALQSLEMAITEDGSLYEAANTMAEIYILKNDRFRAKDSLERSLSINPGQTDAYCRLAEQHEFFHDDESAYLAYKKAVEINPRHIRANAALIRYCLSRNDKTAAEIHFKMSYNEGMKTVSHLLKIADARTRTENYKDAIRIYHTVISISPATIEAYLALYRISRLRKDPVSAIKYLERLIFVKPDYTPAYYLLGVIYFEEKIPGSKKIHIDTAVRYLKKAVELDPRHYESYYMLSDIYRVTGDPDSSEKYRLLGDEAESRAEKNHSPDNKQFPQ